MKANHATLSPDHELGALGDRFKAVRTTLEMQRGRASTEAAHACFDTIQAHRLNVRRLLEGRGGRLPPLKALRWPAPHGPGVTRAQVALLHLVCLDSERLERRLEEVAGQAGAAHNMAA